MNSDMIFGIERALDNLTDDQLDRIVREMEEEQEAMDRQAYEEAMERADILESLEDSMRFSDYDLIESCGLPVG